MLAGCEDLAAGDDAEADPDRRERDEHAEEAQVDLRRGEQASQRAPALVPGSGAVRRPATSVMGCLRTLLNRSALCPHRSASTGRSLVSDETVHDYRAATWRAAARRAGRGAAPAQIGAAVAGSVAFAQRIVRSATWRR